MTAESLHQESLQSYNAPCNARRIWYIGSRYISTSYTVHRTVNYSWSIARKGSRISTHHLGAVLTQYPWAMQTNHLCGLYLDGHPGLANPGRVNPEWQPLNATLV